MRAHKCCCALRAARCCALRAHSVESHLRAARAKIKKKEKMRACALKCAMRTLSRVPVTRRARENYKIKRALVRAARARVGARCARELVRAGARYARTQ